MFQDFYILNNKLRQFLFNYSTSPGGGGSESKITIERFLKYFLTKMHAMARCSYLVIVLEKSFKSPYSFIEITVFVLKSVNEKVLKYI